MAFNSSRSRRQADRCASVCLLENGPRHLQEACRTLPYFTSADGKSTTDQIKRINASVKAFQHEDGIKISDLISDQHYNKGPEEQIRPSLTRMSSKNSTSRNSSLTPNHEKRSRSATSQNLDVFQKSRHSTPNLLSSRASSHNLKKPTPPVLRTSTPMRKPTPAKRPVRTPSQMRTSTPLSQSGSIHKQEKATKKGIPMPNMSQPETPLKAEGTHEASNIPIQSRSASAGEVRSRSSPDRLKLHFRYRKQCWPERKNSDVDTRSKEGTPLMFSESSTSTSSVDEFELVYRFKAKKKDPRMNDKPDFTKYIPVPIPIPLHVPKLLLNKMDPKEWEEAQDAFLKDRINSRTESISDTSITKEKEQILPATSNKSIGCIPMKFKKKKKPCKSASHIKDENSGLVNLSFDTVQQLRPNTCSPKRFDQRFDIDSAEQLVKMNAVPQPNFNATLYVGLPDIPNHRLCHAMTELVVSAMLNYFHPYKDVQCMWISDMQSKLIDLLKDHTLKPRFTRLVYLRKFEAILVLSEDAGVLLRHQDTCFLHSVASALKIPTHKLLILVKETPNNPYRPKTSS